MAMRTSATPVPTRWARSLAARTAPTIYWYGKFEAEGVKTAGGSCSRAGRTTTEFASVDVRGQRLNGVTGGFYGPSISRDRERSTAAAKLEISRISWRTQRTEGRTGRMYRWILIDLWFGLWCIVCLKAIIIPTTWVLSTVPKAELIRLLRQIKIWKTLSMYIQIAPLKEMEKNSISRQSTIDIFVLLSWQTNCTSKSPILV